MSLMRFALFMICAAPLIGAAPAQRNPTGSTVAIDWVKIPGGSFMMGSISSPNSSPRHKVNVSSFEIARAAVTFKQYRACVAAKQCTPVHSNDGTCIGFTDDGWTKDPLPATFQDDNQPVVCVSWEQAEAFSKWVGGRLPSEAEWEYAARSLGKDVSYPWGNENPSCERAIYDNGKEGCGRFSTWRVCSKPAGNTEQGLCDMAGNVMQWLQDWYHPSYLGAPENGSAWDAQDTTKRVVRGGAWYNGDLYQLTTARGGVVNYLPSRLIGFRPVRPSQGEVPKSKR
jgi:formylglycine-generating enzyme required for sulfatase activity